MVDATCALCQAAQVGDEDAGTEHCAEDCFEACLPLLRQVPRSCTDDFETVWQRPEAQADCACGGCGAEMFACFQSGSCLSAVRCGNELDCATDECLSDRCAPHQLTAVAPDGGSQALELIRCMNTACE